MVHRLMMNHRPPRLWMFACALRDRLVADARNGDPDALAALIRTVPANLSPRHRQAWRDSRIRTLAWWLHDRLPDASPHRIAVILAEAGRCVQVRRPISDRAPFDLLDASERVELAGQVADIVEMSSKWPKLRSLLSIIGE